MFAQYLPNRGFVWAAATALLASAGAMATTAQAAQERAERPIVLETSPKTGGDVFECSIPIDLRYEGESELAQFRITAKVYEGDTELASSGITSDEGTALRKRVEGGWFYEAVPMQFDLTERLCDRADGLRIEFARCVFGDHPAEDCLGKIRFAAAEGEDPLFLPLK